MLSKQKICNKNHLLHLVGVRIVTLCYFAKFFDNVALRWAHFQLQDALLIVSTGLVRSSRISELERLPKKECCVTEDPAEYHGSYSLLVCRVIITGDGGGDGEKGER